MQIIFTSRIDLWISEILKSHRNVIGSFASPKCGRERETSTSSRRLMREEDALRVSFEASALVRDARSRRVSIEASCFPLPGSDRGSLILGSHQFPVNARRGARRARGVGLPRKLVTRWHGTAPGCSSLGRHRTFALPRCACATSLPGRAYI